MKKAISIIFQGLGILMIILIIAGSIGIIVVYSESKVPVLCYHNVLSDEELEIAKLDAPWSISVENFEEEMKYLHDNNYKTLTMQEFSDWKEGKKDVPFKSVLVTFDDGLLSNYHYALPILKKYNINATIFVIGEASYNLGDDENQWANTPNSYITKKQIEEIRRDYPNIELYSHTYGMHKKPEGKEAVHTLNKEQMQKDIKRYEEYMGKTEYIAYPFGAVNQDFVDELKENGYKYGFLFSENKKATRKDDDFHINRINVSANKDMLRFKLRLLLPY